MHGASTSPGPSIETFAFFFAWFIGSIIVAYYAMRFTAVRREEREKFQKRQKAEEKRDVRTRATTNGA
jgi:hypothetical protein